MCHRLWRKSVIPDRCGGWGGPAAGVRGPAGRGEAGGSPAVRRPARPGPHSVLPRWLGRPRLGRRPLACGPALLAAPWLSRLCGARGDDDRKGARSRRVDRGRAGGRCCGLYRRRAAGAGIVRTGTGDARHIEGSVSSAGGTGSGSVEDRAARSDQLLASMVAADQPGCSAAVAIDGQVVRAGARGLANLEQKDTADHGHPVRHRLGVQAVHRHRDPVAVLRRRPHPCRTRCPSTCQGCPRGRIRSPWTS